MSNGEKLKKALKQTGYTWTFMGQRGEYLEAMRQAVQGLQGQRGHELGLMNENLFFCADSLGRNYVMASVRKYRPVRFITPAKINIKGFECVNPQWAEFTHGDGWFMYYEKKSETENVGCKRVVLVSGQQETIVTEHEHIVEYKISGKFKEQYKRNFGEDCVPSLECSVLRKGPVIRTFAYADLEMYKEDGDVIMEQHSVLGRVKVFDGQIGPTIQYQKSTRIAQYQ